MCGYQYTKVAVWGLAFKPGTDDMREAQYIVLINSLLANGCEVSVYDPVAMNVAKGIFGNKVRYAKDIYDFVNETEAIFHVTEWKEFRFPKWNKINELMQPNPLLLDRRNVYNQEDLNVFINKIIDEETLLYF